MGSVCFTNHVTALVNQRFVIELTTFFITCIPGPYTNAWSYLVVAMCHYILKPCPLSNPVERMLTNTVDELVCRLVSSSSLKGN